jgi:hypothetical protein
LKNLELAHYVDRLQEENDELRKLLGWLSSQEPQLRIMIETYKRQDGEGHWANMVGEGSGENIPEPPKTHHKNAFVPKPNHLRNRLDTTPTAPMFPPQTNDLQKPIKFMSTLGKRMRRLVRRNRLRSLVRRNRLRSRVERNLMISPIPGLTLSP